MYADIFEPCHWYYSAEISDAFYFPTGLSWRISQWMGAQCLNIDEKKYYPESMDLPAQDRVFHILTSNSRMASRCDRSPQSLNMFISVTCWRRWSPSQKTRRVMNRYRCVRVFTTPRRRWDRAEWCQAPSLHGRLLLGKRKFRTRKNGRLRKGGGQRIRYVSD